VNSFLFFFVQSIGSLWRAVKRRFRQWTKPVDNTLVLSSILAVTRSKSELVLENALLRQQLIVLRRQIKRPKLSWRNRTLIILLASKLRFWKQALVIVQPDTVLRWHRDLFRQVWRRSPNRRKNQVDRH
jgi:putative transposase